MNPINRFFLPAVLLLFASSACRDGAATRTQAELDDLGTRYADAWSSQQPDQLASFYSEQGILVVNDGAPSVGRDAIAATAEAFMTGFPDMVVTMDSVVPSVDGATFHWTWTGTNTGPGGTGRSVHLNGYEQWTFDQDGLILASQGHYDQAEYERQMTAGETEADSTGVETE